MEKKFIIILVVILLTGTGYYFWAHRYDYFFQGDNLFEVQDDVDKKSGEIGEEFDDESEEEDEDINEDEDIAQLYDAPIITPAHCDNKCADFSGENEKEYCEEICGLTEGRRETATDGCNELKDLKRDVCFKQQAIDEKNQSYCEEISDEALRENCENRVLEEIMDQNPAL
ncbi:MAG: hypothetical protein U9M90_01005 [Patescibacteria group bacterium]|nr:hypothetical protein [Patescibacteria group bacterium]